MEVIILKENENELKLELKGEGHTLCTILQRELLKDSSVEMAGYDVPHPLLRSAILYIRTNNGKPPREALLKALDRVRERLKEFTDIFEEAWAKVGNT